MTATIRHAAAVLVGLLLVTTWVWWSAGAASAGGPTSVIMVNPGTGRAAALHTTDPRYPQLVEAVGAYHSPTGSATRPRSVTDCSGCEIRLTWLIHDMQIWRIDRVHLTSDDGIWLESVSDESGGDVFARTGVWQRPQDATALLGLLDAGGVSASSAGGAAPDAAPDPASGVDRLAAGDARPRVPLGLVVAGSGLAGAAVGLVTSWYLRRRRSDHDGVVLSG